MSGPEVIVAGGWEAHQRDWRHIVLRDVYTSMGHVVINIDEQPLLWHFINDLIEAAIE